MTSLRSLLTSRIVSFSVLTAVAVSVASCGGDDIIRIVGSTTPGDFPGNAVSESFKAPDDAAMSHAGTSVSGSDVDYWSDSQSGKAILTWTKDGRVWATFMRNGAFTAPVPIRGIGTQGRPVGNVTVLWLNTSGHSNATARERDGDALILFEQEQIGDPGDANADDTRRLFSAYFDSSLRNTASKDVLDPISGDEFTFVRGFQRLATPVDNDPDDSDSANGPADVRSPGLVSDSQSGSYENFGGSSGDATSFVHALWTQDPDAEASVADKQFLTKQFDLTGDSFRFPTGSPAQLTQPTGFQTGDQVIDRWDAHNGSVFLDWGLHGSAENDDSIVTYVQFDASGVVGSTRINHFDDTTGNNVNVQVGESDIYGADHGLGFTQLFYTEGGFDGDPSTGSGNKERDVDLYVATFDPATAQMLGGGSSTSANDNEIDEFTSQSGTPQPATVFDSLTRISRDGRHVAAVYIQNDDNDASDAEDNRVAKTVAFDTSRDLSASTTPVSGTLVLTANAGGTDEADIEELAFQTELADGQTGDIRAAIQSDPRVMNVTFQQDSGDPSTTDPNTELHLAGFEVTLDASTPAAPILTQDTPDTVVADVDADWGVGPGSGALPQGRAYDNGTNGKANVVFTAQANNSQNNVASGAFPETRLFHFQAGGGEVNLNNSGNVISTDGTFDSREVDPNSLNVVTSPRDESDGSWSGNFTHLFFTQGDGTGNDELMHIPWKKNVSTPRLGPLTRISLDIADSVVPLKAGIMGRKVGGFFGQGDHLYYNQWSPGSGWQSDPDLVDNHYFQTEVTGGVSVFTDDDGTASSVDNLPQTISAYGKRIDGSGSIRLLLRVRQ